jgi:hypothetical protein
MCVRKSSLFNVLLLKKVVKYNIMHILSSYIKKLEH